MKRALLGLALLFLLAGCVTLPGSDEAEGKNILSTLSPYYQTELHYESGGLAVTAFVDNTTPDSCSIAVSAPEHLAGYTYRIGESGIEVAYRDLAFILDPTGAAAAAPLLQTTSALSSLLRPAPDELPSRAEGFWTLSSMMESGEAVLIITEDGVPAKLSLQSGLLEITLENFVFFD